MAATVMKLPTVATSYYEVKAVRSGGWAVTLVTPGGFGKSLRTRLYMCPDRENAIAQAEYPGRRTFRPVKIMGSKQ